MSSILKTTRVVQLVLILLVAIMFLGCQHANNVQNQETITLGYCPTMQTLATELQVKNEQISVVPYSSTAAALSALRAGQVDAVLVGRVAKESELSGAHEVRLREGLTLVSQQKKLLAVSDLQQIRIHTYVSEEEAKAYLPETNNIVYHDSLQTAINEGLSEMVLINWDDYTDNLELVIPIDTFGNKVEAFRLPTLYFFNTALSEMLENQ